MKRAMLTCAALMAACLVGCTGHQDRVDAIGDAEVTLHPVQGGKHRPQLSQLRAKRELSEPFPRQYVRHGQSHRAADLLLAAEE